MRLLGNGFTERIGHKITHFSHYLSEWEHTSTNPDTAKSEPYRILNPLKSGILK